MHRICFSFRCNSYGPWTPTKCDSILIFTSFYNKVCRGFAYFNTKCLISQISNVQKVRNLEQPAPDGWRTEQKPRCDPVQTSKFGELWSPALQQLWPWSRSKVKVIAWCKLKGLVTRIMHAKYQCSIINTLEDMSQVKVFMTDRQTDRGADRRTNEF